MTKYQRAGQTKRESLEEEMGLPFEQARRLRAKYYERGYRAGRNERASLRARLAGALAEVERLRGLLGQTGQHGEV